MCLPIKYVRPVAKKPDFEKFETLAPEVSAIGVGTRGLKIEHDPFAFHMKRCPDQILRKSVCRTSLLIIGGPERTAVDEAERKERSQWRVKNLIDQ